MPVNEKELRLIATGPSAGGASGESMNVFLLCSDDTASAVEANGYFDGVLGNGLAKGDLIFATLDHDGTIASKVYQVVAGGADVSVKGLVSKITDNSGGTASTTLATMTNLSQLTDATSGTANNTITNVSGVVTGVDGTGNNAASKADVDARLGSINDNQKEFYVQLNAQRTLNAALINAVASLAARLNEQAV